MRERLANTRDEAMRCLAACRAASEITYDTETSGLDWQLNHIVGFVLTPRGEPSWYVPVRHAGGGNLPGCRAPVTADGWKGDRHWFEVELAKLANEKWRTWNAQNFIFDLRFSARVGIKLYGYYRDSMVREPLLDENARRYALDVLAAKHGVQAKKGDVLYDYLIEQFELKVAKPSDSMGSFWRTNAAEPIVWQYAAGDGVTTEGVIDAQQPEIEREDERGRSLKLVADVECRLTKTLARMTYGGVRVNEQRLHDVHDLFGRRKDSLSHHFPPGFNSKSPRELKEYFASLGEDYSNWPRNLPTKAEIKKAQKESRPPVGALRFGKEVLELTPKGMDVISFRQMANAQTLYTLPMINDHLWRGGVHTEFAQMAQDEFGAISGRLSCYDPNLQAVSKHNKIVGPAYRSAFEADEGCSWEDRDYKQQEYVVFADFTKDPKLLAGYAKDPVDDIHTVVAKMLGVERDPTAKRMNLGMLYGMGVVKLALSLGVSLEQAKVWMAMYHQQFPTAKPFLKDVEYWAKRRGHVFTRLGRRRHFPRGEGAHKAGNAVIQGTSADITKVKMVEIDEYFASEDDYCRLMLQIHDSLSWSAPKDERGRRITAEADRIMTDFYSDEAVIKLEAQLKIDKSTGDNWGVATFGQDLVDKAMAA